MIKSQSVTRMSRIGQPVLLVALSMLIISPTGCRRVPDKPSEGSPQTPTADAEDDAPRYLSSVVNLLRGEIEPGTYTSAIIQLNKFVQRRPGAIADLTAEQRTQVTRVLGAGNVAVAQRKTFAEDDIEYLRNAFFLRQIARQQQRSPADKVAHASDLFSWTATQVALTAPNQYPAVPPTETLLRSYGQPQERIAIFLELLRQSDLVGGVLAVTTKDDPQGLTPWLVGLLADGEMYLFDPVIGRAIPSPADPARPATLKEVSAHPAIATGWYGATPIVDPARIDRYAILLPIDASRLASRMSFLESNLKGDDRVNLYQDIDANIRQANQTLSGLPNQVGVQVWRFPEETARAHLARRRDTPEAAVRWQQVRSQPRLAELDGRFDDAIKEVVALDLNPIPAVVWDVSLQSLKMPFTQSRPMIAHADGLNDYIGATSQRFNHPEDPSYADEWLERYLKRSLNPEVTFDEIFEVSVLGQQLAGHPDRKRLPLEERIFSLLPEPVQKIAREASQFQERAHVVPAPAAEARPTVSVPEPLKPNQVDELIKSINDLLKRPDLIDAPLAESLLADTPDRPAVLIKDVATLTAEEVRWRNRLLFDRVFLESVVPIDRPWITGALRMRAENLASAGKKEEAIALLEANYPVLHELSQQSLRADGARLKASP
ncbi:hypothetical protein K2X85_20175 [bacterium]|nr:hypothetical protein [bacterium]